MKISLINTYDIGRRPAALLELAARLHAADYQVSCQDIAVESLDESALANSRLIGVHVGMHTGSRLAAEIYPRLREFCTDQDIFFFGLYADSLREVFDERGVSGYFNGNGEKELLRWVGRKQDREADHPKRTGMERKPTDSKFDAALPPLEKYSRLLLGEQSTTCGFADTTRGCKHLCTHCPVVPVYQGRFTVVPVADVIEMIGVQVEQGAGHISFGDADFFNGPGHAMRVLAEMHRLFPELTFDATIKIEHLLKCAKRIPDLARYGCLFITSAVESLNEQVLQILRKNHSAEDFSAAGRIVRQSGIHLNPTFIPFTPWNTLEDYLELLARLDADDMVVNTAPIQLSIRLLLPTGSPLLKEPTLQDYLGDYDRRKLNYSWHHPDSLMDDLQRQVHQAVEQGEADKQGRYQIFSEIWRLAHSLAGRRPPPLTATSDESAVPRMSENWYCCAEPANYQLQGMLKL